MKTNVSASVCEAAEGRDRAFTFLELIAIIGTLAILGALVLPALARSGDSGTRLVCINNLRQMGLAVNMYASDNADRLAFANWDGGASGNPQGWLYYVTNGAIPDPGPKGTFDNAGPGRMVVDAYKTGLWYTYVQNPKSYLCPVDSESRTYQVPASQGGRNNRMSSYVANGATCGYQSFNITQSTKTRVSDAWSPKCYLLWEPDENAYGPGDPGAFQFNDGSGYPINGEGPGGIHTVNGSEILSLAGNVGFATMREIQANANGTQGAVVGPGGKTLLWWSPYSSNGH